MIEAICATGTPADSGETVDSNRHGRQEHRSVETFDVQGRLGAGWDGLITTAAAQTSRTPEFAVEGSVFVGGAVVQWLRDGLRAIPSSGEVQALAESVKIASRKLSTFKCGGRQR